MESNLALFELPDLHLRVRFSDGGHALERFAPDQRLGAVGYAMVAATVADGSVTPAKLAAHTLAGLTGQIAALSSQLAILTTRHEALAASVLAGLQEGVPLVS